MKTLFIALRAIFFSAAFIFLWGWGRFGSPYDAYCRSVRRWLPRRSHAS